MAETPQKRPTSAISEEAMRSLERITDPFYTVDSEWRSIGRPSSDHSAFGT